MKQVDFANGNTTSNIVRTALPLMAAQCINLLYNIVDRIFIARIPGLGTSALGAVGLCFPIIMIITAFTCLLGSGGAPLFSIELGKHDENEAAAILSTSFSMLSAAAIGLMILFEVFARPALLLMGASEDSVVYAIPYLRIYLLGTFSTMIAGGLNSYINAQGFPVIGMTTITIGAVANLILDPIFIFVLGLGIPGAAIATVLAQILSAIFVLRFLFGPKAAIRLHFPTKSEREQFGRRGRNIASLGLSSFIMQFTNSMVTFSCNNVLQSTGGDIYVSVMTLIASVRSILDVPCLAFSDGASPIISYNYGARRPDRVRTAIKATTIVNIGCTFAAWCVLMAAPQLFVRIFSNDPEIMKYAAPALRIYFFTFVFQALQYSGQTVFKALNKKKNAIFFSIFRKVVMVVPLTYLLPYAFGLGPNGVFIAEPISNFIGGSACFITMLVLILPELKKMETA